MSFLLRGSTVLFLIMMGTLAGFFFAFSFTVMPGFDLVAPKTAIEAMQGINIAVRNPVFFVFFFLTPVLAGMIAILAWGVRQKKMAILVAGAGAIYLIGGFALTVVYHIPMNEALAVADVEQLGATAADVWQDYTTDWTPWNTFRTIVCAVAMVPAAMALMVQDTKA